MDFNLIAGLGTCIFTGYLAFFAYTQNKDLRKHHQALLEEQNKHHKQKSTIELLIANSNNAYYRERRQKYMELRDSGTNFTQLACLFDKNAQLEPPTKQQNEQNFIVLDVLNSIEFICVEITENIFDEAVYKRMSKGSVIKDWNTLKPYIMELRRINHNQNLFCEFEALATKWIENP